MNGIDATTGQYLSEPPSFDDMFSDNADFVLHSKERRRLELLAERQVDAVERSPMYGVDVKKLDSAGWGVIFGPDVGADVRQELRPLLELRRKEAGDGLYFEWDFVPGTTRDSFLAGFGISFAPPNPAKLPYYLLLVGDPRTLPFSFQYAIDVQYAVGRLHFETAEEYGCYARGVLAAESGEARRSRSLAFFAAENPNDKGSEWTCRKLVEPLARTYSRKKGWKKTQFLSTEAKKEQLCHLLGQRETQKEPERPSFLFTATHGAAFPYQHQRLHSDQGALICQDWKGPGSGPLSSATYLAAADVKDSADVRGLVAFNLACYSGGTPEKSYFKNKQGRLRKLADFPFVSRLAQRLLGHPQGGALAVCGHVDRAWTTSFAMLPGGTGEIDVYRSTIDPLLDGHRVGFAMEYMNQRYAELSVALSDLLRSKEPLKGSSRRRAEAFCLAANDAKALVLLGDPAVRLAVNESRETSQ